jgi:hypothetical protein
MHHHFTHNKLTPKKNRPDKYQIAFNPGESFCSYSDETAAEAGGLALPAPSHPTSTSAIERTVPYVHPLITSLLNYLTFFWRTGAKSTGPSNGD